MRWAEKEQRREADRRRTFWEIQKWMAWRDMRANAGAVAMLCGAVAGALAALALRGRLSEFGPIQATGCIVLALTLVAGLLAASAKSERGFWARQLILPAMAAFAAFSLVLLLGVSQ